MEKQCEEGPLVVTRKGKPVGVLIGLNDKAEIERLALAYSPKLQAILDESAEQIRQGKGLDHETFWAEVAKGKAKKSDKRKR